MDWLFFAIFYDVIDRVSSVGSLHPSTLMVRVMDHGPNEVSEAHQMSEGIKRNTGFTARLTATESARRSP